jgi:hypothetical protein
MKKGETIINEVQDMTLEGIYKEYQLIRQKKSKLSRGMRDAISARVERIAKRNGA